ncbi:Hypothetical predicted protein [Podarcis lilfordi]|uniref:Uncharacterized protein n=1 Tax=Podarcis lilfordi TaxID=74358 RepID=A0AA35LI81_9SAUR|nr:Hypothetical predicted protein [Podarcis lilfordi]
MCMSKEKKQRRRGEDKAVPSNFMWAQVALEGEKDSHVSVASISKDNNFCNLENLRKQQMLKGQQSLVSRKNLWTEAVQTPRLKQRRDVKRNPGSIPLLLQQAPLQPCLQERTE